MLKCQLCRDGLNFVFGQSTNWLYPHKQNSWKMFMQQEKQF